MISFKILEAAWFGISAGLVFTGAMKMMGQGPEFAGSTHWAVPVVLGFSMLAIDWTLTERDVE